mmetsp:Transcript_64210/g.157980  ORF Transcript_64210/g.157980 Transcript_64210/m.157980 type:complete len:275 (-) Transcript_64210:479-1303(-)
MQRERLALPGDSRISQPSMSVCWGGALAFSPASSARRARAPGSSSMVNQRCGAAPHAAPDEVLSAAQWVAALRVGDLGAQALVEPAGGGVGVQHPEVERVGGAVALQALGHGLHQPPAQACAFEVRGDMQVVEIVAPGGVVVGLHVGEADEAACGVVHRQAPVGGRYVGLQPRAPDGAAVGVDLVVEVVVGEDAAVGVAPGGGVQGGDGVGVGSHHVPQFGYSAHLGCAFPRRMSSRLAGASGARKSGIVRSVLAGRLKNSTCHSAMRSALTWT